MSKQEDRINYIKSYLEENWGRKTTEEMRVDLGYSSKSALSRSIRGLGYTNSRVTRRLLCKEVNKDFFKVWTRDMAYVLGFFYADGCLEKRVRHNKSGDYERYYLTFWNTEKSILEYIKRVMGCEYEIKEQYRNERRIYYLKISPPLS